MSLSPHSSITRSAMNGDARLVVLSGTQAVHATLDAGSVAAPVCVVWYVWQ